MSTPSPESLAPRSPWSFAREALQGGGSGPGIQFLCAWGLLQVLTSVSWARHLMDRTGTSALPNYWGELLTARDVWELLVNGGLRDNLVNPLTQACFWGGLLWMLWAGWHLQARTVNLSPRLSAWAWALLDTACLGLVPIVLTGELLAWLLSRMASLGIPFLGWMNLVGGAIIHLAVLNTLMLQWWLCRVGRASQASAAWRMGSWGRLGRHLGLSFLRLWSHPFQWSLLVTAGVVCRAGLFLLTLKLAWRLGGATTLRVWGFCLLLLLVTVLNAWLIGWFLRLVALFWRQDEGVRAEVRALVDQMQS
jgi:hypothetical protein